MGHQRIEARRLIMYCSETAKYKGKPLFDWLLQQALEMKMGGATAIKALSGFGQHQHLHHLHLIDLSCDLPVVVEVIDRQSRIDEYLETVTEALKNHTYILEEVWWHQPQI